MHPDDTGTAQRGGKSSNMTGNQSIWCFSSWPANNLHGLIARACSYEPVILKSVSQLCQCNFTPLSSVYKFMSCKATGNGAAWRNFLDALRVLAPSSSQHQEEDGDLCIKDWENSKTTLRTGSEASCGSTGSSPFLSWGCHPCFLLTPLLCCLPSGLGTPQHWGSCSSVHL